MGLGGGGGPQLSRAGGHHMSTCNTGVLLRARKQVLPRRGCFSPSTDTLALTPQCALRCTPRPTDACLRYQARVAHCLARSPAPRAVQAKSKALLAPEPCLVPWLCICRASPVDRPRRRFWCRDSSSSLYPAQLDPARATRDALHKLLTKLSSLRMGATSPSTMACPGALPQRGPSAALRPTSRAQAPGWRGSCYHGSPSIHLIISNSFDCFFVWSHPSSHRAPNQPPRGARALATTRHVCTQPCSRDAPHKQRNAATQPPPLPTYARPPAGSP